MADVLEELARRRRAMRTMSDRDRARAIAAAPNVVGLNAPDNQHRTGVSA